MSYGGYFLGNLSTTCLMLLSALSVTTDILIVLKLTKRADPHAHRHECIHSPLHTHTRTYTWAYTHMNAHMHIDTLEHADTHTYIDT